jgi:regulator of sigma E protease
MVGTLILALAIPGLDAVGKILVFLLMLSILVVLHEGGHFLLARLNGVRVNDFAVGFGPTLLKWTSPRSGTNYRLNLLPIGGYCAMQGEDGNTTQAEQQREFRASLQNAGALASSGSGGVAVLERPATGVAAPAAPVPDSVEDNFQGKTPLQRLSIVVAGPVANFILAFVILLVAALLIGVPSPNANSQVAMVLPDTPAARAGLQMGDQIVSIDGQTFASGDDLVAKIHASAGKHLAIVYRRHGVTTQIVVTPKLMKMQGKMLGMIGFMPTQTYEHVGLMKASTVAAQEFVYSMQMQFEGFAALITHPVQRASSMSGVIGMGRAASQIQDLGWGPYLSLAAQISIALGVLNLVPFPALDGGRAVFILAEMLRGRPVEAEKEQLVHLTGFAVLMVLMVFVAFHDIENIVTGKGVF